MIGSRLGTYEITGELGAGGMGEVYRATDTKLDREVAIKVLPAEVAADAERLARFEREARLLAALNHPNIAHVYGFESATLPDGSAAHLLAMELVEGEDLSERLKRGPVPVDEALGIAKQIAEALEEAHAKSIVHRDLKPANVKLTPDGKVKVLDFGLAKAYAGEAVGSNADLSRSPTLARTGTQAGVILGTAAYMSPEQARGKPVDKRTDIWAFGVVLFELLTGRPLFEGETVSDVLAAVLKNEPRWSELPTAVPSGVRHLLRRCLERDARNRLHDIADARIELSETTSEGPLAAGASLPAPGPPLSHWRRIAVGAALLVVGGLLGVATNGLRARPEDGPRVRFTVTPPGSGGRIQTLRFSRDGRRLVYHVSSEPRLLVHDLDAFESRPLAGTEGATTPFLSPDGAWIGLKQAGKLRKIALDGGDPVDICDLPQNTPDAAWGPGDVILFSPAWTNVGLWRVNAGGGEPVELTRPDRGKGESGHFWPDFLPDGRAVLFTIWGGKGLVDSKVGLLDLETRRYEVLFEGASPSYLDSGHILYYKGGAYRAVPFDGVRRRVTGPETTVLPAVRRLDPVGDEENFVAFSTGGALAFVEGDSTLTAPLSRLTWVSREGRRQDLPFEAYHDLGALSLSPDGTRAAVSRVEQGQKQVYLYDLARGTGEAVTRDGQSWSPTWHPDGRRLAVTSQLKGNFDVRRLAADAASAPEIMLATDADEGDWRWAPDGASGVFKVWSPVSGTDLWRARGDGSEPKPLVASALAEGDPAFSPDGKWLAYQSGGSLYVAPYPSLAERLLVAQAAESPRWSRSAKELFYVEAGRLKALAYEVRAGAFRPAAATTLFEVGRLTNIFDVAPDGRRFLFLARPPGSPDRDVIRVVLNGFEELRGRAPVQGRTP
jgi:serine/threonine-protein kinase